MKSFAIDWTEKYRPSNLNEIIGNTRAISQLRSWGESWSKGKPKKKGAILVGTPGIGKTSAAHALAADFKWDVVELNASDKRNASVIDRIVGHGSRADGFSMDGNFHSSSEGELKLIVFDEADNLFGRADYGGARAIVNALKNSAQPIVLIVNDYYELTRRASGIKSHTVTIRFSPSSAREVMDALKKITTKEELDISIEVLQEIANNSFGDIRAAVNDLQSIALLENREIEEIVTSSLSWRDIPPKIFDSLDKIFTSENILEARQMTISIDETPDRFITWIDDNLPRVIRGSDDRLSAIESLSRADIFLGRVSRRQYYGFWSYATDLMSMGVAQAAQGKYKTYSGTIRFPEYLTKLSRSKARRASLNSLLHKVAQECHTSSSIARESIIPYMRSLFMNNRTFAIHSSRRLELLPGEIALLLDEDSDSDAVDTISSLADSDESLDSSDIEILDEHGEPHVNNDHHQRSLFEFR